MHDTGKGVGNLEEPTTAAKEGIGGGRGHDGEAEGGCGGEVGEQAGGADEGWEEEFPSLQGPFKGPALPRDLLAARMAALEERVRVLQARGAEHPKVQRGQELLAEATVQLKDAGGRTQKRLLFSLAGGLDKIEKCERGLEEERRKLKVVEEEVQRVLRKEQVAAARVEVAEEKLENTKSKLAWWGFQAAAELGSLVEGYNDIEDSVAILGAQLAAGGTSGGDESAKAFGHVARFIRRFAPSVYDAGLDPVMQELASSASSCAATTVAMGRDSDTELDWRQAEAEAEMRDMARENLLPITDGQARSNEELLEGVRQAAAAAVYSGLGGGVHSTFPHGHQRICGR